MTDKQIIIDDVDVSGCEFLNYDNQFLKNKNIVAIVEENEKLKKENSKLQKEVNDINVVFMREHIGELKAENEKLKEKFKSFFNIDNQECWDIAFLNNEKERYKQALDLISDICNEMDGIYLLSLDILDIINKAKEQE